MARSYGKSLALVEVGKLAVALLVADRCVKAAAIRLIGIENTDFGTLCLKMQGSASDVAAAARVGEEAAALMKAKASVTVLPAPDAEAFAVIHSKPVFSPLMGTYDAMVAKDTGTAKSFRAIGLLETQGLVALLHATDAMLKTSDVSIVGKEKIGGGYVTVLLHGDLAAVEAAIAAGKRTVEQLGGKLVLADVISNPHGELSALLP